MSRKHAKYRQKPAFDGGRPTRSVLLLISAAVIGVFLLLLLAVDYVGDKLEPEQVESLGSLDGRFEPTLTLQHEGKTYEHQELDYTTILFIGVDKSVLSSAQLRGGGQADFLLLLTIDRNSKQIDLLQIDRDTITDVQVYGAFGNPAGARKTQIGLSYAFGSTPEKACQNTVRAVSDMLLGIPIDHYMALDMDGMTLLNDALGGVTVTLEDDFSAADPEMTPGKTIRLQGKQAEIFLRSRMSIGDGTNQSRMNRQAVFLDAAAELLSERMSADADFINELLKALEAHLVTSCSNSWLISQAYSAQAYTRTGLMRLGGEHAVGSDGFAEFHPDTSELMTYILSTFCE